MAYFNVQKRGVKTEKTKPTVHWILSRYKQSIGGKTVLENLNALAMKGIYKSNIESLSGTFEFYAKSPDKYMSIISVPDYGIERNGYNGKLLGIKIGGLEVEGISVYNRACSI